MSRPNLLDELADALRFEGLDVRSSTDGQVLVVGTARRGELAEPAAIRIRPADAEEYLDGVASTWDGDDPAEYAFGMLVMLLVEALSTVHDGENNLVTEVELRRGTEGRLGLHQARIDSGAPLARPGDVHGWTPDRP